MNSVLGRILARLPSRWVRSFASLRTQLIFWNVVALSLLVGGLGIACRYVTLQVMMQSVDQDLERGIRMYLRPPPSKGISFRFPMFGGERHEGPGPDQPQEMHGAPPFEGGSQSPMGPNHSGFEGGPHSPPGPGRPGHGPPQPPDSDNPLRAHHFTAEGKSEMPSDNRAVWDPNALAQALKGETLYTTVTVDGDPVRILSSPSFEHTGKRGAIQNAYPLKDVYRAISGIDSALLLLIPVGLLGAGWVGVALTNRVLKQVHWMTLAAGRIGAEDFSRRLPVSGYDEFSELATTFNGLLGRLERAFQEQKQILQQQRRFTADASHELKTPLTIIKGRAGLALSRASTDEKSRHTFEEIEGAVDTMSQLVQDLLLLARSDGGQMGRDPIEMLVREVLESARTQALEEEGAPIVLNVDPEELSLTGNEAELVRLFRNLLDNAVRYSPAEGRITVTARASNQNVVVTVEDTGTGIAPEHLPHLGERFYRVDASRTRPTGGTGLGLSICRSIAEAHGGTLTFQSALGVGTKVTVILPQRPVAED